jgi:hypothetical protein
MFTYTIINKLIVLESNSRLEDRNNNFRILDSKEVGYNTLDLDILPIPFNFLAKKL